MWFVLCLTVLLCAFFCMALGYLLARLAGLPASWAFLVSPIIGIAEISLLGEAYALAHVPSSPVTLMVPLVAVPLVALLVLRRRIPLSELPPVSVPLMAASLVVGAVAGYFLFVAHLFTYWSIYQTTDTPFHLNEIRAFADSGCFTVLHVDAYLGDDAAINPLPGSGFYPTAWHSLCALLVQATGRQAAFAINASMWFFTGGVWPLAVLALTTYLFPDDRGVQWAGVLASPAFALFPWTLLLFGPEYPNLAGFATLPLTCILFMRLFGAVLTRRERVSTALLFALATIGQALLHPNTLFSAVVLLVPFCVDHIWRVSHEEHGHSIRRSLVPILLFVVIVAVIWVGLYLAPPLRGTVSYEWDSYAEPFQQLVNTLTLSYDFMFSFEYAPQYVLGAMVLVGFVRCLYDGRHRWCAFSYVLPVLILMATASYGSYLVRHLFGGFWYSDPIRISAMCVIAATPLAAFGMDWTYSLVVRLARRYNARSRRTHPALIAGILSALFLVLNFAPNVYLPGNHVNYDHALGNPDVKKDEAATAALKYLDGEPDVRTTFGNYSEHIDQRFGMTSPLSLDELAFLDEVAAYVQPGDVIINDPLDGSFMAYGSNDLRLYYRSLVGYGAHETDESWAIRERLCDITTDQDVRDAVSGIGAKYVLVLSEKGSSSSFIGENDLYLPLGFRGISSIHDDTPGFEVALSSSELRLYRIVGQEG